MVEFALPFVSMRTSCSLVSTTIALFLSFSSANAGDGDSTLPPRVRLPSMKTAPKIDGILSPGEWDGSFMGSGVAAHKQGGIDTVQVQYWFGYDEKNVYLAAQMETPPGRNLLVPPRRLAKNPDDFHFEILIDPVSSHPDTNWVQAMFYPMGIYKNLGYSQRIGGFVPYDIGWSYKDSWKDDTWTIEASAPIEAFNRATLRDGNTWGVLFGGVITAGPYYFSGTVGDSFSARGRFLKVIPDESAPIIQVTEVGDIASGKITPKLLIRNTTKRDLELKIDFSVKTTPSSYFSVGLDTEAPVISAATQSMTVTKGASGEISWSAPLPKDGTTNNWLSIAVTSPDSKEPYYKGIYKLGSPRLPKWKESSGKQPAAVLFETHPYPSFGKLKAIVDFGGYADPEKVVRVVFRLMDGGGSDVAVVSALASHQTAEEALSLPPNLPIGDYVVKAELLDSEGRILHEITDNYKHQRFEFENNKIGLSDKVLFPWTPIRTNAGQRTIEVWNRTYTLAQSGLPEQIIADGKPLLAGPISIVETIDGISAPLKGESLEFIRTDDVSTEVLAKASGRALNAEVRILGEYDGMLKYEVTFNGVKGARVDGLDLIIPLHPERAKFLHATGDGCRSNYSHALPSGSGTIWDSTSVVNWVMPVQWLSYLWMGDYERGLCWWADSAEGWTLPKDKKTPVVKVRRNGKELQAVLHLVNHPSTVLWKDETPRKLVFALEATPIKPRAAWGRDIGRCDPKVTSQKGPHLSWMGSAHWAILGQKEANKPENYTFAYLRPINADAAERLAKVTDDAESAGKKVLIYTDMRARALVGEIEKRFAWEWNPSLSEASKPFIEGASYNSAIPINSTQSRIDYDLWCFKGLMDLGVSYFYFDEIQNEGQHNPLSGLGYEDDAGRQMPTMRLFQYRQLWKRLYTMMQERGQKEPVIVAHNTSTTYAGPMAFCTTTWDFEEANSDPAARQLTKFGIDYLNTEAMGHQYGFVASTLGPSPTFERWIQAGQKKEESEAGRHWMGVHMILDMNPYLTLHASVLQGLKILGDFGWNEPDCKWIPYWKAFGEGSFSYKPTPEDRVYVSAYQRGSKALLIFLNDTNKEVSVEWSPSSISVKGSLTDAEDPNRKIAPSQGAYIIPVPRYNYRALLSE